MMGLVIDQSSHTCYSHLHTTITNECYHFNVYTVSDTLAFGSGWAWLSVTPSGLKVTKTIGAGTPLTDEGFVPILTCKPSLV